MIGRVSLLIVAVAVGAAGAILLPGFSQSVRRAVGLAPGPSAAQSPGDTANGAEQRKPTPEASADKQTIKLTDEQNAAAQIELVAARAGILARRLIVRGTIVP